MDFSWGCRSQFGGDLGFSVYLWLSVPSPVSAKLRFISAHRKSFTICRGRFITTRAIGLVGPNGAGKSSILKLLAGEMETSEGVAAITKGVRVGYLPQEVHFNLERSVLEEALDASPTLAALEKEMHDLEAQMGAPTVYDDAKKLTRVMERHARVRGRNSKPRAD